jgi:hypothetical protein
MGCFGNRWRMTALTPDEINDVVAFKKARDDRYWP